MKYIIFYKDSILKDGKETTTVRRFLADYMTTEKNGVWAQGLWGNNKDDVGKFFFPYDKIKYIKKI